jgi:hypothetical protein
MSKRHEGTFVRCPACRRKVKSITVNPVARQSLRKIRPHFGKHGQICPASGNIVA